MTDEIDDIAALSAALREVAKEHPKMAEPINKLAKNVRYLLKHPDDAKLMRETSGIATAILVALGKLPLRDMPDDGAA